MNSLLIAFNIIKRVVKSPKTVIAMVLLPIAFIFTMIIAMKDTPATENVVLLADLDGGAAASEVGVYLKSQGHFVKTGDPENFAGMVRNKKAGFAVVIPRGFSAGISEGRKAAVDFYYNGNDAAAGRFMQQLDRYISRLAEGDAAAGQMETGIVQTISSTAGSNGQDSSVGANPSTGFAVVFIMIFIFTTIGIILEDKKKLTLARMYVYPVREWEIILGNLLGSLALGALQLIPLVAALMISFNEGSFNKLAGVFIIFSCFLIAVTGIGIGISGLIKKAFNPVTLIAAVITPTSILGGCFIPGSMLPGFINTIGYLVPQKWVMDAIARVLGGENLMAVSLNLAVIILFGLTFATFGLKTLRPLAE